MPETMTEQITEATTSSAPVCICGKSLTFDSEIKSWRCFSCCPVDPNTPICATQKCKRPLTRLGDPWNCWLCLHCNTHPSKVNPRRTEKPERKYVDQKMNPETVQEMIKKEMSGIGDIVRETMAEFNLKGTEDPDYPPTRAVINELAEAVGVGGENVHISVQAPKPETWLQKAKRIGVQTHKESGGMRKKTEIMAEIETEEKIRRESDAQIPEELRTEEQTGSGGGERPSVDIGDAEASE